MIIDTSVLMVIMLEKPEAERLAATALRSSACWISAGNWVELGAVMSSRPELNDRLMSVVARLGLVVAPVDEEQARIGHQAYRAFGKGHHPAKLNFGDCFAYALAKATGEPLLFKGDDFIHTDVARAL